MIRPRTPRLNITPPPALLAALLAVVLWSGAARGQYGAAPSTEKQAPAAEQRADIDPKLGQMIAMDAVFKDESGKSVRLADYFDGRRPVALNLIYFGCPGMCKWTMQGTLNTLKRMEWQPGSQYQMITISFDHTEGPDLATSIKGNYIKALGPGREGSAAGWHYLTGSKAEIQKLTSSVGFNFYWNEKSQPPQFVHSAGMILMTPKGQIARYLGGTEVDPLTLRMSLVEASGGTIGNFADTVFAQCYSYDPSTGSYVFHAIWLVRIFGALTVAILTTVIVLLLRREFRRRAADIASHAPGPQAM